MTEISIRGTVVKTVEAKTQPQIAQTMTELVRVMGTYGGVRFTMGEDKSGQKFVIMEKA